MEDIKYHKIIIKPDWELTDVISAIDASQDRYLLLTFADKSDLLLSPITIKVIQKEADKLNKVIVFQIVQNPTGIRNAKKAEVVVTDVPVNISQELWDKSLELKNKREQERQRKIKQTPVVSTLNSEAKDAISTSQKSKDDNKAHESSSQDLAQDKEESFSAKPSDDLKTKINEVIATTASSEVNNAVKNVENNNAPNELKSKINEVIARTNKPEEEAKVVNTDGLDIALDEDISALAKEENKVDRQSNTNESQSSRKSRTLVGKDLLKGSSLKDPILEPEDVKDINTSNKMIKSRSVVSKLKTTKNGFSFSKSFLKILSVGILLLILIAGFFAITFLPKVNVKVFVQSKEVSIAKDLKGDQDLAQMDFKAGKIPIKQETVEKTASTNIQATGKAFRGTRAEGVVTVKCLLEDGNVDIPAGTKISTDNKSFVIKTSVSFECPSRKDVSVTADDVGEEYNIPAGAIFTIPGFDSNNVFATNNAAFSGGYKEEYKVFSQEDYDKALEDLKKTVSEEAHDELKQRQGNVWQLIESTIDDKVKDDDIKVDIPVGAEADVVNMSIKMTSSAWYFKVGDINDMAEKILLNVALSKDMFNSDSDLKLVLNSNIDKTINVKSADKKGNIVIFVSLKGVIRPEITEDQIKTQLVGKSWDEGLAYLESLRLSDKPTEVNFSPEQFPRFLWKFPNSKRRINVEIVDVVSRNGEQNSVNK